MSDVPQLRLGLAGAAVGVAIGGLIVLAPFVRPPPRGPITAATSAPALTTAIPKTNALPNVTSAPATSETAVEGSEASPTAIDPAPRPAASHQAAAPPSVAPSARA